MHTDTVVQERAAARASQLPNAELTHQATGDWTVWKVGGKVFMLQTFMPGEPVVILKADPSEAELLRETHENITHGYHMNKTHWITLKPGGNLPDQLIDDLVAESYLLVVEGLPKLKRPVDPETFRSEKGTATAGRSQSPAPPVPPEHTPPLSRKNRDTKS